MGHRKKMDVVGIGQNATDTVMRVKGFPAPGGKARVQVVSQEAGGSVATALVTCRRLGLRVRYIGAVGDDEAGEFQTRSLRRERIGLSYLRQVAGARSQVSHIVIDQMTGERTVFWERDARLEIPAEAIHPEAITGARALHLDGSDIRACVRAARIARKAGIPVVADLDTFYPGIDRLFPFIDYLIVSSDFLAPATEEEDFVYGLELLARESRGHLVGVTLGGDGALVLSEGRFLYSPGFRVEPVDTTGAGDVFHGAFIYALVRGWPLKQSLEFSNACAALNSTKLGARGGIPPERAALRLMATGKRNENREYVLSARARIVL